MWTNNGMANTNVRWSLYEWDQQRIENKIKKSEDVNEFEKESVNENKAVEMDLESLMGLVEKSLDRYCGVLVELGLNIFQFEKWNTDYERDVRTNTGEK